MTVPIGKVALLAGLAMAVAAGVPAWAGGDDYDAANDKEGKGPVYFGFVRDVRGAPVSDARVVLQPKSGDALVLKSNVLGIYRSHVSKDFGVAAIAVALIASPARLCAQQGAGAAVSIDADDIGGVVGGPNGPEAGVWVIAETTDLPTGYIKSVVTDDQGRYLIPDLPPANYDVWVRGYGLVDSAKVRSAPGRSLNLTATPAPTPERRGRHLSFDLLVLDAESAAKARISAGKR